MSRVVKSELKDMARSSVVSLLRQDSKDARALRKSIENFINGSTRKLTGPNYDLARELMSQYVLILKQRENVSDQLADAIKNGCNSLASYMGQFAILDDAERAEYERNLQEAQNTLNYLNSIDWTDKDFDFFDYWSTYFNCKRIIKLCTEYLEKLDGLPGADASAYGPISTLASSSVSV